MEAIQSKVVLSSGNISHFHQIALALQQIGLLERYYCSIFGLSSHQTWHNILPRGWRKKLQAKALPELDSKLIREIPLPYLFAQGLGRSGIISEAKSYIWFNVLYDRQVSRELNKCDVFHFVNGQGLITAEKAKQGGSLLVCGVREIYIKTYEALLSEEYSLLGLQHKSSMRLVRQRMLDELAMTDYILATTEYAAQTYVANGFSREKIFVVPYGVDQGRLAINTLSNQNKYAEDDDVFRILYVGQTGPLKGLHYLIKAFTTLNLPKSELIIIGGLANDSWLGPEANNKQIRFLGHLPRVDLWQYYQRSSVFVLPSIMDSFGLVVSEAMAAGLPVLVTENVGAKEMMRDGQDGFVVPIRNVEALQEKILWLYEHPDERMLMGQQARNRVREFTWEKYRERIQHVYLDILHKEGLM